MKVEEVAPVVETSKINKGDEWSEVKSTKKAPKKTEAASEENKTVAAVAVKEVPAKEENDGWSEIKAPKKAPVKP